MDIYKNEIVEAFKDYEVDIRNKKPGIRWAFDEIKDETQYIILGINPSNSYHQVKSVIKESGYNEFNDSFGSQEEYDRFLADSSNEDKIKLLQRLAHKYHRHFKKHRLLLNKFLRLTERKYQFFDLFPVWRLTQKDFMDDLSDSEKEKSIEAFKKLIDRHLNISTLIFCNAGAADFFVRECNRAQWVGKEKVIVRKKSENRASRNSIVRKGELKLSDNRVVDIYGFGIGGYFGAREMESLVRNMKLLSI